MILDLHIHTNWHSGCSILDPFDLVLRAIELKLDGIVITEHNYKWTEEELNKLRDFVEVKKKKLLILSGQEVRAYKENGKIDGDILTFGFYGKIKKKTKAEEIISLVHKENAVAVAAHPYRNSLGLKDRIYELELDGIEVLNSNHTEEDIKKAEMAAEKLGISKIGGSDAHEIERIGKFLTYFEEEIFSERDLIEAIKLRKCKPIRYEDFLKK